MHKNYLLFESQVKFLRNEIIGETIQDIFTYRKNELIIELNNRVLAVSLNRDFPSVLLQQTGRIRQPKLSLLKEATGDRMRGLHIQAFDKRIWMYTDSHTFEMIFFGRQPNVFLLNNQNDVISRFKDHPRETTDTPREQYDFRTISTGDVETLCSSEPAQKLEFFLQRHFGAMSNNVIREILHRLQLHGETTLHSLGAGFPSDLSQIFHAIRTELSQNRYYIYYDGEEAVQLTLFPFTLNKELRVHEYTSPNEAWIRFSEEKRQSRIFGHLIRTCRQAIKKREAFLINTLHKIEEASNLADRKEQSELIGNLLLTNKHRIKPGSSKVILENIFSDTLENIEIKLDPRKSVAENARVYFEKYKNIDEKRFVLETKKDGYMRELDIIRALGKKLEDVRRLSELKKIYDTLAEMKVIQDPDSGTLTRTSLRYAFNRLILDKQWDVYIGKNGPNNDLLTFSFANKWDLWFHAQGVPGSHVIIHLETKDATPPAEIIMQAAQIAAANSKALNSETVPVVYTRVKHVSRIRKAPQGTVKLSREKVIFVKPLKIS